ncbi:Snf7-domain-containing protein [Cladochytrium replicatum]|nr:Snf7-domain-containing protein [Cladochytrium replicatum]
MNIQSLFGRVGKAKANPNEAIMRLRESLDTLDKREKYLLAKVDQELKTAKANASKNKRAAILALKRKRMYEDMVDKIGNSKLTLETQVMALESSTVMKETMDAMRHGASAMKNIHGSLNIDKVDQTMDDIREQMDLANELSTAISQPIGALGDPMMDDDELLAELEELEQEELDAKLLDIPFVDTLPDAPLSTPETIPAIAQPPRPARQQFFADDDEDKELAELRASMAI